MPGYIDYCRAAIPSRNAEPAIKAASDSYALALSLSGKPPPLAESSSILANFFGTIRCYARGKYKAFRPSLGTTQTRGCWFGTDCLRCRKTRKRRSGCRPLDGTANVFVGSRKRRCHLHSSSCHPARMGRKGVGVPLETSSSRWMSDSRFFASHISYVGFNKVTQLAGNEMVNWGGTGELHSQSPTRSLCL